LAAFWPAPACSISVETRNGRVLNPPPRRPLRRLRFSENKLSGKLPADLADSARTLLQLQLHNNAFEGDLYALKGHSFVSFTAHGNAGLCGMVPLGTRYAHGFSFWDTGLGLPCPGELENGIDA
jgi:hypothetical protein